nr:uncharacterized protein LOC115190770 isoform X3 [Salmo trutta]
MAVPLHNRFQALVNVNDQGESTGEIRKVPSLQDITCTKGYFKALQAIHHSEILDNSAVNHSVPAGMVRQVNKLAAFIKPSSPNQQTLEKVKLNTSRWMENNMHILREHYDGVIALCIQNSSTYNQAALDKAVMWAKARYKHKFTSSSVNTLKNMLQKPIDPPASTKLITSHQAHSSYAAAVTSKSPTGRVSMGAQAHRDSGIGRNIPGGKSDTLVRDNMHNKQAFSNPVDKLINHSQTITSNTTGLTGGIQGREVQVEVHVGSTSPYGVVPSTSSPTNHLSPPLWETCLTPRELGPAKNGGTSFRLTPTTRKSTVIPNPQTQRPRNNLAEPKVPALTLPGSQQDDQQGKVAMANGRDTGPGTEPRLEPVKNEKLFYPTCHFRTERKINDWSIEIKKPVVFIGDSNLARISGFTDINTQIDSFPGATFRHIAGVIGKLEKQQNTQKVVLSVGLVNGLNQQYTTAVKQLQQLLNKAGEVFPHAQVYVPIIHFSDELPREKQEVLNQLNKYIQKNCRELLDLNKLRFHTVQDDPIHWRPDTAVNIFNYWLDQLNY